MKKTLFIFISVILVSSLVACNNQHPETEQKIQVGDTIPGADGETFEIYVWDENLRLLTDDKAKVTVNVVLEKENDINNKDDYTHDSFCKYTYTINICGVVDKKYAGRTVYLSLCYTPSDSLYYPSSNGGRVHDDGSFNNSWTFSSGEPITEWAPRRFAVLN